MSRKTTKLELLKPFRILLNLLDKPEIGSAILEDVLIEVFKNLFISYQHFNPKESVEKNRGMTSRKNEPVKQSISKENPMEELIKTGNLLFNTFEPYFMWQYIAKLLAACNRDTDNGKRKATTPKGGGPETNVSSEKNVKEIEENYDKLEVLDVIRLTDFILNIVALVRFFFQTF